MKDFEQRVIKMLGGLQQDVKRLELLQEETDGKIDSIIEAVSPEIENTNTNSQRLDDHESKITTLETAAQQ